MLKRIVNWMNKPFTIGMYLKICAIGTALTAVVWGATLVWIYWRKVCEFFHDKISRIKNFFKFRRCHKGEGSI